MRLLWFLGLLLLTATPSIGQDLTRMFQRDSRSQPIFGGSALRTLNLSEAYLEDSNLSFAKLSGANLTEASLDNANLRFAQLSNANLKYAFMTRANLSSADLRNSDLRYAILVDAILRDADLEGADLRSAILHGADLFAANLSDADFRNASFSKDSLRGTWAWDDRLPRGIPEVFFVRDPDSETTSGVVMLCNNQNRSTYQKNDRSSLPKNCHHDWDRDL